MRLKTKNTYKWDIDKEVNYFFTQDAGLKYKEELEDLSILLPNAKYIVDKVHIDILKNLRLHIDPLVQEFDPEGVKIEEELSCSSLFNNTKESDDLLLRHGLPHAYKFSDLIETGKLVQKYEGDPLSCIYLKMLIHTLKTRQYGVYRSGNIYSSKVAGYNQSVKNTLSEITSFNTSISDDWSHNTVRQGFYTCLSAYNGLSTNNNYISINNSTYCTRLSKFATYLKMVGPTLIASIMYPELTDCINSVEKYPTKIDFLNNIMKLRCIHSSKVDKGEPLTHIVNDNDKTLYLIRYSDGGSRESVLTKIAQNPSSQSYQDKMITVLAANASLTISFR
tara:strand:- start:1512 stop:2516 length:1005 start_codon:yes stop_codon:yes gene_type:complete